MVLKSCLIFLVICAFWHPISGSACKNECNTPGSVCSCNVVPGAVVIDDGKFDGRQLIINCTYINAPIDDILSDIEKSDVYGLLFHNCPLPSRSFAEGIDDLKWLEIFNDFDDTIGPLTPTHLNGIKQLDTLKIKSKTPLQLLDGWGGLDGSLNVSIVSLTLPNLNLKVFQKFNNVIAASIGYNLTEIDVALQHNESSSHLLGLILIGNQFTKLSRQNFHSLTHLQSLTLQSNDINEIEEDAFGLLEKLEYITLVNNSIPNFPARLFQNLKNLYTIDIICGRSLDSLPDRLFANLIALASVSFECGLTSLPENLFKESKNIHTVNFAHNKLTTLPANLFADQYQLVEINFSHNHLTILPENFFRTIYPKRALLRLNHNRFKSVSDAINGSLPETVKSSNGITVAQLYETYRNTHNFKQIIYQRVPADVIYVDLRHNQITNVLAEELRFIVGRIFNLNLGFNSIRNVDAAKLIVESEQQLTGLFYFDHNPIDCSCDSWDLIRLANQTTSLIFQGDVHELQCTTPDNLAGKNVKSLTHDDLNC